MTNDKAPKLAGMEKIKDLMKLRERIVMKQADAEAEFMTKCVEEYFAEKEKDIQ